MSHDNPLHHLCAYLFVRGPQDTRCFFGLPFTPPTKGTLKEGRTLCFVARLQDKSLEAKHHLTARRSGSSAESPRARAVEERGPMADGCGCQNQWYHFGVGAPPILVYFGGDWDVHWGYGMLTHGRCVSILEDTLFEVA